MNVFEKILAVIKSIFTKDGEWSSKRVLGLGGAAIILGCYIYCVRNNQQMPEVTEFLFGGCIAALGIDPVTDVIGKISNKSE